MEPTNELITKSEAYAEGFSVVPNNECMTKAEFVANLPTPLIVTGKQIGRAHV